MTAQEALYQSGALRAGERVFDLPQVQPLGPVRITLEF